MNKNNHIAKLLSLLFTCVFSVGLVGASLVASARTSNDNDNKTTNGRVARRPENSDNNTGESDRTKPKPKGSTTGTTTTTGGGNKPTNTNQGEKCKGKACNQKG